MIPLRDHDAPSQTPYVTYVIIGINVLIFIFTFLMSQSGLLSFFNDYALVAQEAVNGQDLYTFITSMFLHGSFGHIIGNMLFLNIFGNNMEKTYGRFGYLAFYLICGIAASVAQIVINPSSTVFMIGASGAIAGLMGGYLILFPNNRIDILVLFGLYMNRSTVPAYTMLIYWFIAQLFYGIGQLGFSKEGGIAFFAHIGGFITGVLITIIASRTNIIKTENKDVFEEYEIV